MSSSRSALPYRSLWKDRKVHGSTNGHWALGEWLVRWLKELRFGFHLISVYSWIPDCGWWHHFEESSSKWLKLWALCQIHPKYQDKWLQGFLWALNWKLLKHQRPLLERLLTAAQNCCCLIAEGWDPVHLFCMRILISILCCLRHLPHAIL